MKRALVLLALLAALSMGAGATLALFRDAAANADNRFAAGMLQITAFRDMQDPIPGPLFYLTPEQGATPDGLPGLYPTGPWAPGDTHTRILHVLNTGNLAAWIDSLEAIVVAGDPALLAQLQVQITAPDLYNPADLVEVASGSLADFVGGAVPLRYAPDGDRIALEVGDLLVLYFHVHLPLETDNSFQGLEAQVHFQLHAEQMAHNP